MTRRTPWSTSCEQTHSSIRKPAIIGAVDPCTCTIADPFASNCGSPGRSIRSTTLPAENEALTSVTSVRANYRSRMSGVTMLKRVEAAPPIQLRHPHRDDQRSSLTKSSFQQFRLHWRMVKGRCVCVCVCVCGSTSPKHIRRIQCPLQCCLFVAWEGKTRRSNYVNLCSSIMGWWLGGGEDVDWVRRARLCRAVVHDDDVPHRRHSHRSSQSS